MRLDQISVIKKNGVSQAVARQGGFLFALWIMATLFCPVIMAQVSSPPVYVSAQPLPSEGIYGILRRYSVPPTRPYLQKFRELNQDVLNGGERLQIDFFYHLPILIFEYDQIGLRTTLGIEDELVLIRVQEYNELIKTSTIAAEKGENQIWAPVFYIESESEERAVARPQSTAQPKLNVLFGEKYRSVPIIDRRLEGYVFYLDSGHGGPDPGAIGERQGVHLYEDEYAYDFTLRLARQLVQHSATVYLIVQDKNDGIRDQAVLKGDRDERYYGDVRISSQTATRLKKRAEIINQLYQQNAGKAKAQYTIVLHVDSRSNSRRIDLFYYYQRSNEKSRRLASLLHQRVKKEYAEHQPGRGYSGTVSPRNLFMLKEVVPATVYIEVANIRNQLDQDRLMIVNNRQAVANWLCDGIMDYIRKYGE
ncbi:MAG: N-acetylmuramoyl-L-alanine amidase [Calditrichaeota bacterium]|nr:MAG: N-acetylmuramoyl-L-alanine amidase [Calditrichota bacterium]